MNKAKDREFQIDDWTLEELRHLFDEPVDETQLHKRSTAAIESATKKGDDALASFLRRAVAKLQNAQVWSVDNPVWGTQLTTATASALGNEYYPGDTPLLTVTGPSRENTTKVLTNEEIKNTRAPAERGALNQQTVFSSDANQGTINPILRQEFQRILVVDSQYRPISFPHPKNVHSPSSTTNFHANLSEPLNNVVSLKLQSITVPRAWNNFSPAIGNTVIGLSVTQHGTNDEVIYWYSVSAQYALADLVDFAPAPTGLTPLPPTSTSHPQLHVSRVDGKTVLTAEDTGASKVVLFSSDMPSEEEACRTNSTPNCNLATSLGFAPVSTSTPFIIYGPTFAMDPVDSMLKATAQMPIDLHPIRYFVVVLDDFNTNRINKKPSGHSRHGN